MCGGAASGQNEDDQRSGDDGNVTRHGFSMP
jgi:hypothetical protein